MTYAQPRTRTNHHWSPEDYQTLRDMTLAGATAAEIAAVIGTSAACVGTYRNQAGITFATGLCGFCRAEIPDPVTGRRKRYCSRACADELRKAYLTNERVDRNPVCEQCQEPLGTQIGPISVRFCGPACSSRAWYERARTNPRVRAYRRKAVESYRQRLVKAARSTDH